MVLLLAANAPGSAGWLNAHPGVGAVAQSRVSAACMGSRSVHLSSPAASGAARCHCMAHTVAAFTEPPAHTGAALAAWGQDSP